MSLPFEFVLLRPYWLLLLPFGIVLAYLIVPNYSESWKKVCDKNLLPHVMFKRKETSKNLVRISTFFAWCVAVLALSGPAWDRQEQILYENLEALVIVFDLSLSMNSVDLAPNRLERARYKAIEIVESNEDKAIGLVVFAGTAFDVTPVSDDTNVVIHLLQSLDVSMMPVQGSYASAGLNHAEKLLERSGYEHGSVILLADEADSNAAQAASRIRNSGHLVSVIGIGTTKGGPIELENGEFLKDASGEFIFSPIDPIALDSIAQAGGGTFSVVTTKSDSSIQLVADFDSERFILDEEAKVTTAKWKDRGYLFVLLLLPVIALTFRRGWMFVISCVFLGMPHQADAFEWEYLWQRSEQRAMNAVNAGKYDDQSLNKHPQWNGIAQYRTGNYEAAAVEFGRSSDKISIYNHGNALAKHGNLYGAIEQYEMALEIDPEFEDARFNLELVKKLLESQELAQGEEPDNGEESQQIQGEESNELGALPPNSNEDRQSDPGQVGDESQDSAQQQRDNLATEINEESPHESISADNMVDISNRDQEMMQVMDQWLRQIEDDPSGLLRRKFHYEQQTRTTPVNSGTLW